MNKVNQTNIALDTVSYNFISFSKTYEDIKKARIENDKSRLAKIYKTLASKHLKKSNKDSTLYYLALAKEEFKEIKDTLNLATVMLRLSTMQIYVGDYYDGEKNALEILSYLKNSKDFSLISYLYNNLAVSRVEQKDFSQGFVYYQRALQYSEKEKEKIGIMNNLAVLDFRNKNYLSAIEKLSKLMINDSLYKYPELRAKVIDNLAYSRWLNNPAYNPIPEYEKALKILENENKFPYKIDLYKHISEYYTSKDISKSIFYAKRMYNLSLAKLSSPVKRLQALEMLVSLEESNNYRYYLSRYLTLKDSIINARIRDKSQFSLIQYEVQRYREESTKLRLENALKDNEMLEYKFYLITIALVILVVILIIFYFKIRNIFFIFSFY